MAGSPAIALSELLGALSRALDVAEGEPPGHAARSCLIGMRLGAVLGLGSVARSDLFYALLLKDAGCSANSAHMAALFGADDQVAKHTSKLVNWARPFDAFLWSLRTVAPEGGMADRTARLRAIRHEGQVTRSLMRARCYRGAEIARKLGFSEATAEAIRGLDEHWDGHGQPLGLHGTEIPLAARILCLAQTVEVFVVAGGVRAAYRMAGKRRGEWFDPTLVTLCTRSAPTPGSGARSSGPDLSSVEPPDRVLPPTRTARPHRRRLRRRGRREVAVDARALRASVRDRDRAWPRGWALTNRTAPASARRAAARPRQAVDLQPHPRQAGTA